MNIDKHFELLRKIAVQHYELTGKPISGITGELGEYNAAKLLNLSLISTNNNPGYDAVDKFFYSKKYQIKALRLTNKRPLSSNSFNHVSTSHKWDYIVFCILNSQYKAISIYRMTKLELGIAQTKSGKKYKHITLTQVVKHGELVKGKNLTRMLT